MLDGAGRYTDDFADATGLSSLQNVRIGPALVHGVRVSVSNWSWAQSYTKTGDVVTTPFDASSARFNLTQVNGAGPQAWSTVSLWNRTYLIARDMTLDPGVSSTSYFVPWGNAVKPIASAPSLDMFGTRYVMSGPFETDLVPNQSYTATLQMMYCNSPNCNAGPDIAGAAAGTFDVIYGATTPTSGAGVTSIDVKFGTAGTTPPGNFNAPGEGIVTPYTLEWKALSPLPPGRGYEYRFKGSMTSTGSANCTPNCTATLWMDTVTVMAMGKPVSQYYYDDTTCAGMKPNPCVFPCTPSPLCILDTLPSGWDTASWFIDSGSYVSPVFDSLSEETVWQNLWWNTDQGYNGTGLAGEGIGWPSTPVGIKWRVGNSPDPSIWLSDPTWYTWTIPNTVTCTGERSDDCTLMSCSSGPCDCEGSSRGAPWTCPPSYPPPMDAIGSAPLFTNSNTPYADGSSTRAVGRYFQYEVDFTSRFANDKFPVTVDGLNRELHQNKSGSLNGIRAYYLPAVGAVVSNVIKPATLSRWRTVKYDTELSTGGSVQVDVLDASLIPLFTNIPSGFSLAGLDPTAYPSLRLRAHVNNHGINTVRPTLLDWEVDWDTFTEPLQVDRNSINLTRNETARFTIAIVSARPGSVALHDAAGQIIRKFFEGVFLPGVTTYVWDGTNKNGDRVAPGVYFLSLNAKEIRRTRKIAVTH